MAAAKRTKGARVEMRLPRPSLPTSIITFLVVVTLTTGVVGYLQVPPEKLPESLQSPGPFGRALDIFYLTLGLLWLGGKSTYGNPWLMVGRWAGALFGFASLVKLLSPRLAVWLRDLTLRGRMLFHPLTVVIGFGQKGQAFARDASGQGVVLALDPVRHDLEGLAFARPERIFHKAVEVRGDGLARIAKLNRAARVVIATGADLTNLSICRSVIQLVAPRRNGTLDVLVHVGDRNLRLEGLAGIEPEHGVSCRPFSPPALAARRLSSAFPFGVLARLLGARDIHLVLVGFDEYAKEILLQAVRLGSLQPERRPRVTILTPRADVVLARLNREFPALSDLADVRAFEHDLLSDLTENDMMSVEGSGGELPVTSVVVNQRTDQEAILLARRYRELSGRYSRWAAPFFVHLDEPARFAASLAPMTTTKWLSRSLDAFGDLAQMCSQGGFRNTQEELAKKVHDEWNRQWGAQAGSPAGKGWHEIGEEYRDANRRAVDHFEVKLAALGYVVRADPPALRKPLEMTAGERAMVAELEHESWVSEKRLAGWRFGPVRDSIRRHHKDLRPFRELGAAANKDLSQVDHLGALLVSPTAPTCFRERRIALVEEAELGAAGSKGASAGSSLAELLESWQPGLRLGPEGDELWTFVVPFRAGDALSLAREVCRVLADQAPDPTAGGFRRYRLLIAVDAASVGDKALTAFVEAEPSVELVVEIPRRKEEGIGSVERYLVEQCQRLVVLRHGAVAAPSADSVRLTDTWSRDPGRPPPEVVSLSA